MIADRPREDYRTTLAEPLAVPAHTTRVWLVWAILLAAAFLGHLAFGYETDELTHLHQAWNIGHGLVPYRDFYAVHLPLFHIALSPIIGMASGPASGVLIPVRIVALVFALLCIAGIHRLLKRDLSRTAAVWGVGAWIVTAPFDTTGLEFRPDWPALACFLGSVGLLTRALAGNTKRDLAHAGLAGMLAGSAACLTQKAAILCVGMVLWGIATCLAAARVDRSWRAAATLCFVMGLITPPAALMVYFNSQGAAGAMLKLTFGAPLIVKNVLPWRHALQESLTVGFGLYALAFAEVVGIASRLKEHLSRASLTSLTATLLLIGTVAQIHTPAPTRQWLLISITPWVVLLASGSLVRYAEYPKSFNKDRQRLIGAAILCSFALFWHNTPFTLLIWAGIAWIATRRVFSQNQANRRLVGAFVSVIALAGGMVLVRSVDQIRKHEGTGQRQVMEYIANQTAPNETILTVWPTIAPFSPSPSYHWFYYDLAQDVSTNQIEEEFTRTFEDGKVRFAAVQPDIDRKFLPRFIEFLKSRCRRLDGVPASRHRLEVFRY